MVTRHNQDGSLVEIGDHSAADHSALGKLRHGQRTSTLTHTEPTLLMLVMLNS